MKAQSKHQKITLIPILFIFASLFDLAYSQSWNNRKFCGVNNLADPERIEIKSKIRRLDEWRSIKINVDFTHMESQKNTNFDKVKAAILNATETLGSLLQVQPETFTIPEDTNISTVLEIESIGTGILGENITDFDLYIFPKFKDLGQTVIANAKPVHPSNSTGRPLTGIINVNTSIDYTKENADLYVKHTILHELIHVLGFNYETIKNYYKGANKNCIKTKEVNGVTKSYINCTKTVETARKYFNCPTLDGVLLENDGDQGTAGSHWENRILLGDLMTGYSYEEFFISEITLALLEDSGWYKANYYTGGLMRFGKGKGCAFLEESCIKDGNSQFKNEFFTDKNNEDQICTSGRTSCAMSILTKHTDLPAQYDFFGNKLSGRQILADYCPVAEILDSMTNENGTTETYGYYYGNCLVGNGKFSIGLNAFRNNTFYPDTGKNFPDLLSNTMSDHSFCAMYGSDSPKELNNAYSKIYRSRCFEMFCSDERLSIKFNNTYYPCPKEGGKIQIYNSSNVLLCPDFNLICTGKTMCNSLYNCISKQSTYLDNTFNYSSYQDQKIKTSQNIFDADSEAIQESYEISENGKCPINCTACEESKKCLKCRENTYMLNGDKSKCTNVDDINKYYLNATDNTYYLCSDAMADCTTCKSDKECTKCDENVTSYMLKGDKSKCVKVDDINKYYLNATDNTYYLCSDAIADCTTCKTDKECNKCDENVSSYLIKGDKSKCVKVDDIKKYYLNANDKTYYLCSEAIDDCVKCNSKEVCTECIENFAVNPKNPAECLIQNVKECKNGTYLLNGNYTFCEEVEDIDLYYFNNKDKTYYLCSNDIPDCKSCKSKEVCDVCKNNYFFDPYSIKCVKDCGINYVSDKATKTCKNCRLTDDYKALDDNSSCYSFLPKNAEVKDNTTNTFDYLCYKTCLNCPEKGNEANHKCSSCYFELGYYAIANNSTQCIHQSTSGYAFNKSDSKMYKCHSNCKECFANSTGNGVNEMNCKSCASGYHFYELKDFYCVKDCTRYYIDDNLNYVCINEEKCPDSHPIYLDKYKRCIEKMYESGIFLKIGVFLILNIILLL